MSAPTLAPPILDVFVPGTPATKGSMIAVKHRSTGRAVAIPTNSARQREWSAYVRDVVAQAYRVDDVGRPFGRALVVDAVHVHVEFILPRRKSCPKITPPHTRKPDGDKLTRCAWDAMTGVLLADDSQIVSWSGGKREAEVGETPGATIRVHLVTS